MDLNDEIVADADENSSAAIGTFDSSPIVLGGIMPGDYNTYTPIRFGESSPPVRLGERNPPVRFAQGLAWGISFDSGE